MKRPRSSVDERRLEILKKIQAQDEIKVEQLAEEFGLSLMTVRRDLQFLESRQLITRFYGGATAKLTSRPLTEAEEIQMYRQRIAQFATRFISSGDTLFINGSKTALDALRYLQVSGVHVITNNGAAIGMKYPPGVTVTLTGGEPRDHVMVGDYVMRNLLNMTANKTFIGCAAITAQGEFCYNIPMEIGINEAMISRTTQGLYILADHTKLQKTASTENRYGSCIYEGHWTLITDEKVDPEIVAELRAMGKHVYVVGIDDIIT